MPPSSSSNTRRRRRRGPSIELRIYLLGFGVLCLLGAVIVRLWWVQVAKGSEYASRIAQRSQFTIRIPSVRGEIRDRNGIPLVQNRASYEVDFYLPDMITGFKARNDGQVPYIQYQGTSHSMAVNKREPDIVQIVNSTVIPRLESLDLARDYSSKSLKTQMRTNEYIPFTYLEDIDFPTLAKFSEHDVGLPGVNIGVKPVRQYLYGALAANLLGYVGMPVDVNQEEASHYNFYQPDVQGKTQIEFAMDKYLRGTPGVRVMQRNTRGAVEGEVKTVQPKPGANVYLTIDARIQMIAEQALRQPALGRAAVVVVNPNNGDILAMASIPSYDPNVFIPSISGSDFDVINKNPAAPLVDRAVSAFPPGSTFKVVTALAGLTKNMANKEYNCSGSVPYGNRQFHCWIAEKGGSHGTLGISDALKVSCDCFFYQYGNAAGIEAIDQMGSLLGFGQTYNIGLSDEKAGIMPGPTWMKEHFPKENWSTAYTANVSIGQGYVLATPLQIAMAYATVANGGVAYEPRLVRTVLNSDGTPARDDDGNIAVPDVPKVRGDLRTVVSQKDIETVRKGLWEVVNATGGPGGGGTGSKVRVKGTVVAGKTGTADSSEHGKHETIAWLACFAPYDHPKYVVVAMVQGGKHGGSVAGPVAQHVLEQVMALDQGSYNPQLVSLKPDVNPHPFNEIDALPDYSGTTPALVDQGDESAPGDQGPSASPEEGSAGAKPDIKNSADAQGNVKNAMQKASHKTNSTQSQNQGFLQRFFHPSQSNQPNQQPSGGKRPHWPF